MRVPRPAQRPGRSRPSAELTAAFAETIRDLRRRFDMTQQELANAAGVHLTFVGRIENEHQAPSLAAIEALARAFGMEAWQLLKEVGERKATGSVGS